MKQYDMWIGGQWVEASSGESFESFDPYTGKPWALIPRGTAEDVDRAVRAAAEAFQGPWSRLTASARGELLLRLGELLVQHQDTLAETEVRDNGKLIAEMKAQMRYLPKWYTYFGGLADKIEGSVMPIDKPGLFNYTRHEPVGVVAAITPWNSPLMLLAYKIAPALAAGNCVVIKPSEYTSASTLEFAKVLELAGFPAGVVNVVTGLGAEAGAALTAHPLVDKVSFTGSDLNGQKVYEDSARTLKRVSLELGGKSPNIVFADAVLEDAVKGVVSGVFAASGQSCLAGSRLLVEASMHDRLVDALVAFMKQVRLGDPSDAATQIGPIATPPQHRKILDYIDIARAEGATCVLGGKVPEAPQCTGGQFVEPTIFTGVTNRMRIAREEVFGPVLTVIPFETEEEAVEIANDTPYGLAAGVWTQNMARAIRMVERIRAGTVWVNTYRANSFMSPFGGYKRSGLGRENGIASMREFMELKTVFISTADGVANPFILR
ncbi:aldehyde dehydrogenase [Verticiella sediminum]|uniref:Aldehyde dehydrogenase n=1 Tax=Verticiella sediminum TaxID=1247510 RepID=A0A556ACF6_9BURK|nr:aldehyde dehydrogenase [Verticiella sediminum]TSH90557.1 aldehyde dehydrogenase [Verticiella sediminum]